MRPDKFFKQLERKVHGYRYLSVKGRMLTSAEHVQPAGLHTHPVPFHAHTADRGKRAAKRIDARLAEG